MPQSTCLVRDEQRPMHFVMIVFVGSEQSEERIFFHILLMVMEEVLFASEVVTAKNVSN
jgi:hypothetical protein